MTTHELDDILNPKSLAIVGASNNPAKWGGWLMSSVIDAGYEGEIIPINPKDGVVLERKAYPSILEVPQDIDMVSVCIGAGHVPAIIRQAVEKRVKCAVILTNGFREVGRADLEEEIEDIIRGSDLRIIGPNIQGIINTGCRLHNVVNMSYPPAGNVGVLAQSGSVGAYITERMEAEQIGISALINLGNQVDLCECDFIDYFSTRDDTDVLALYLEGPRDKRRFKQTLIDAASRKPIVLMKPGVTDAGASAAASHTGSIAGNDVVFTHACRQFGVVRCSTMTGFADTVKGFAIGRAPSGNRVLVLSTSGGVGSVAVDELIRRGFALAELPPEAIDEIKETTNRRHGIGSVIDFADSQEDFRAIFEIVDRSYRDALDAYFIMVADQMPEIEHIIDHAWDSSGMPMVVSYMSDSVHQRRADEVLRGKVPVYETPDRAAEVLRNLLWYSEKQRALRVRGLNGE